ncbi:vesicular glutamate transporter 2 [Elysia marginata]|uniref:Vesicular glutamate transporter 2 n=1 Tax=Elysia marginata TaxID=1093978 RepID=A0AAV4GF91_9GAST|nr:vesicular glutamate transporter 2 [Elysia marginata]
MVNEKGAFKGRKLSLDIEAASKAVNFRPSVWKSPTDPHPTLKEAKISFTLNYNNNRNGNNHAPTAKKAKSRKKKQKKTKGENSEGRDLSPITPPVIEPSLSFREKYFTWRYTMVLLLQASFMVALFLKNNMPVALVCMAKPPSAISSSAGSSSSPALANSSSRFSAMRDNSSSAVDWAATRVTPSGLVNSSQAMQKESTFEFDWDGRVQSLLLTATLLLSFSGPLVASALHTCINKKTLLTLGSIGAAVLTGLCPFAARISPYFLAAIRVVMGILFGFNVPVIGDSLAWWAPQGEKLMMVSLTFAGINIGSILTTFLSGFLCAIPVDNGWPFIFYVFDSEKAYIIAHRANLGDTEQKKKEKPPYGKILKSAPVLAYLGTGCCQLWVVNLLSSYLPIFYVDILGFTIQQVTIATTNDNRFFALRARSEGRSP